MNRDFELPGGFQDADIEMAQLTESANRESALARKGICAHGWIQCWNPTYAPQLKPGQVQCKECGKIFDNEQACYDERQEVLS